MKRCRDLQIVTIGAAPTSAPLLRHRKAGALMNSLLVETAVLLDARS